ELARVHDLAADVHLHVNVNRATRVPAWIDRREDGEPVRVRLLDPAQKRSARSTGAEAGVVPRRVRMPDVDGGSLDRRARGDVHDSKVERQERPRMPLTDVAAHLLARDVVR